MQIQEFKKLDLKNNIQLKAEKPKIIQKTKREKDLEHYTEFFKRTLSKVDDIENSNYTALEIVNDEGLTVSSGLHNEGFLNFKVCNLGLIETLVKNPLELQKINLIHAVLPFDESAQLLKYLIDIPKISKCKTKVALGMYANTNDPDFEFQRRIFSVMMRRLDFFEYKGEEKNGTDFKLVLSAYQKNMKLRR